MQTASLTLDTLGKLSTELKDDFEKQLKAAVADCRARPGCSKPRSIHVELKITPSDGDPEDVVIAPVVKSKTPASALVPILARRSKLDQLQFDFEADDDE
jgi:hypothetical protein